MWGACRGDAVDCRADRGSATPAFPGRGTYRFLHHANPVGADVWGLDYARDHMYLVYTRDHDGRARRAWSVSGFHDGGVKTGGIYKGVGAQSHDPLSSAKHARKSPLRCPLATIAQCMPKYDV
jgi:hypothetical protein